MGKLAARLGVSLTSLLNEAGSLPPLHKKSAQALWQDPILGYGRRQVSRTERAELVEITLPTGCQISYPAWTQQPYRQQLWLISGEVGVTYGSENFQRDEGDCLSFAVDLPVTFRNIAAGESRYLLVITKQ
ncbi:transcriptional regulator [Erwinia endophytica]|uniref:cupin domain-containing protein n=1 Tax=Erwinia endophytica TaxID=1563158 RepID=UPI001265E2F9|nr:cupin domain-containing protein [Erwinia endophytica]KAB8305862.1 transcriptional regulator [Erwinia endophytica]